MGFKINRVYTRTGDKGDTSLVDASRVPKNHPRCCAFGGLDEVSCHLGLAKDSLTEVFKAGLSPEQSAKINIVRDVIEFLQQELFDLGSELATPKEFSYPGMWTASSKHVKQLEKLCDYFNNALKELDSFILPGGDISASHMHVARAVIRRVERELVGFLKADPDLFTPEVLQYCNRLSDLFFVIARYLLEVMNREVPLWKKGIDRTIPIKL